MAADALQKLLKLLDLEYIEENIYRGRNRNIGSPRVFGGQVLAQALVAAARTVGPERPCHSLHAYFILPGDLAAPIVYDVGRTRDGGSFTTRGVHAIQHGRPIFNLIASFHREEGGHEHQAAEAPEVPGPEGLADELELLGEVAHLIPEPLRGIYMQERPFTFRPVDPLNPFAPEAKPPRHAVWFKAAGRLPEDPTVHRALLAYASDHGLLPTALRPHGLSWIQSNMQVASLDHAIWFHRPFRVDEWLLYAMESPRAAGARGFTRGAVYQDGALVASVAQEGLMRKRTA